MLSAEIKQINNTFISLSRFINSVFFAPAAKAKLTRLASSANAASHTHKQKI